jgi:hypothetical protein
MATPKFDNLCISFLKRIPDEFVTTFTGSAAMPAGYILTAAQITDYVNRGLMKFFNDQWNGVFENAVKAGVSDPTKIADLFAGMFPELVELSAAITLSSGNYTFASPYLHIFRIIGAYNNATTAVPLRIWKESAYPFAKTAKYAQYQASASNPALIQLKNQLCVFPQASIFGVLILYIKYPLLPTTGGYLVQNHATVDSPFAEQWEDKIAETAYGLYLKDTYETE